jgi:predicted nucleic acid-binding protein
MASKVFLDTNYLLDLTLKRSTFPEASKLMQMAISRELEAFTTPAVLHITSYFLTKAYNASTAKAIIGSLLNDVTVIDCNHATAVQAINSSIEDLEDALQYYTALTGKLDYFVSMDARLKKKALPQLPVLTAKQLLAQLLLRNN